MLNRLYFTNFPLHQKTQERKDEYRRLKNEGKKKRYAKIGPNALREANRRYQATFRSKHKKRKNDQPLEDLNKN